MPMVHYLLQSIRIMRVILKCFHSLKENLAMERLYQASWIKQ